MSSKYQEFDPETGDIGRKRSLVRPERQRLDRNHPRFHYTQVATQELSHIKIQPGLEPVISGEKDDLYGGQDTEAVPLMDMPARGQGTEVIGLNDEAPLTPTKEPLNIYFWKVYSYVVTFWAPAPLLSLFGIRGKARQFAWREKMALISCILILGAFVAFLTFGFTRTVCPAPPIKIRNGDVLTGYLIINGRAYDLTRSQHPQAAGVPAALNILYPPVNAGGQDASFLFQNVNGNCKDLIVPRDNCLIPYEGTDLAWYMPCRTFSQYGGDTVNDTEVYYNGWACHTSSLARDAYYSLKSTGDVFFTWGDIRNSSRNLVVYAGAVLDLDLIEWISSDDVTYPDLFDRLRTDSSFQGHDISLVLSDVNDRKAAKCLSEIIKVGVIDSESIGCIASNIVLIVALVFILSVVVAKFLMACYYRWVVSGRQGASGFGTMSMVARERAIDNWVDNPNAQAPISTVPVANRANYKTQKTNRQSVFFRNSQSHLLSSDTLAPSDDEVAASTSKYTTMSTQAATLMRLQKKKHHKPQGFLQNRSLSTDLLARPVTQYNPFEQEEIVGLRPEIIHPDVVPQPPVEHQPFGYPLAHTLCLITAYSEDEHSLRTTLDSVATTDYPNSHKLLLVICDGMIKGEGNEKTTPDLVLDLMTDFCTPREEVQPHSYIAVVQGAKRHNMAKVYAGFYKYDDATVPPEKQQRVPVICLVKCGTPEEAGSAKPGNRGKRDSQIILMSFLQKVTFDERMTALEYAMLESIWRVTGLMAEFYEVVLMVDADTMVYPDCLTHMVAEMVKDPTVMGLCGETKIANKTESWVTAIQVFEYYISHHQAKAFESVFGGVTCLPGCFSMFRIKTPKGNKGYWVPILANPDIVERYSNNVVDTLHKKNLLLLGEDRFLSSLMLRTFPRRKQIFVSKAACKTVVPLKFMVLLSQRRRWINSTVHNLMELVLVKDLCGTFCFSMQFVIMIELVGTLVLPAAILFTVYVIIFAIISTPTPILSIVLLAIIFGLPGALIVITVSSWDYVIYFFIYLAALPIWNFVLPMYSYWKFDDFSWGETRTITGGDKGDHSATDGVFDHSSITMKRWREWEREKMHHAIGNIAAPGAVWDPSNNERDTETSDQSNLSP